MGLLLFGRTQDAWGTPFDNTDPNAIAAGFSSNTVQEAIIEAKNEAAGTASRFNLFFGWDGSAGVTRWLEQYKGVPSNKSPFVITETSKIKTLAIAVDTNTTATVGLFKNAVLLTTVSLAASKIATVSGLDLTLNVGDTLSARPTSGTVSKPALNIGIQVIT